MLHVLHVNPQVKKGKSFGLQGSAAGSRPAGPNWGLELRVPDAYGPMG